MKFDTPGLKYDMPVIVTYDNPAGWPPTQPQPNTTMAQDQNRRLDPDKIQEDIAALEAIQGMTGYAPANSAYALTALTTAKTGMQTAQATETQKKGESDAARDAANTAEWAFHNAMLEAKNQVKAQFGVSSDQVQALGLKKKSEYKKGGGRKSTTTPK